jgi:hypothetical protein
LVADRYVYSFLFEIAKMANEVQFVPCKVANLQSIGVIFGYNLLRRSKETVRVAGLVISYLIHYIYRRTEEVKGNPYFVF